MTPMLTNAVMDKADIEYITLQNLDVILRALNIEYNETYQRFFFSCPIHGSDNYNSMSLYKESGNAICFTRNCMNYHGEGYGVFKFVSACLKCSLQEAISFCEKVLCNQPAEYSKKEVSKKPKKQIKIPIEQLPYYSPDIPYLLRRGYKKETIAHYKCFVCNKKESMMYGRVVFPIFDDEYENCIGYVGRSLFDKCEICGMYHSSTKTCPSCTYEMIRSEKWINSSGLSRNSLLFNYWFAKKEIERKKEIILVESQNCVMRLYEAEILNSVGIFGIELNQKQLDKIISSGAERVYIAMNGNGDKAGMIAAEKIKQKITSIDTTIINLHKKDFGEMSVDEIRQHYSFLL